MCRCICGWHIRRGAKLETTEAPTEFQASIFEFRISDLYGHAGFRARDGAVERIALEGIYPRGRVSRMGIINQGSCSSRTLKVLISMSGFVLTAYFNLASGSPATIIPLTL